MGERRFNIVEVLRDIAVSIGWKLFCWGARYPEEGFVCDFWEHPLCEKEFNDNVE